jgi:NAD(P)-dependent dehydrogenase (short-subunit alcohol dehydrogenase family)
MSRTVLVTGSSSGIGLATARLFASEGWSVAATARSVESVLPLESLGRVAAIRLDVTDPDSIASAVEETTRRLGPIDVLVNNAGFAVLGPFEATTADQARRQFDTNLFGLMDVTRAVLPILRERKAGTIVNVASIGGKVAFPFLSLYHGTKWAVEGFSEALMLEVEPFGVRVKLVEPGVIKTDFYGRSMDRAVEAGATPYSSRMARILPQMDQQAQQGASPELVARAIFRAATDGRRKFRYPVHAFPFLPLRKLLPDAIYFAILRSFLR